MPTHHWFSWFQKHRYIPNAIHPFLFLHFSTSSTNSLFQLPEIHDEKLAEVAGGIRLMARTNNHKYTSINFNHILEKNVTASSNASSGKSKHPQNPHLHPSSPFSSYSSVSSPTKTHGRMLVLTRPTPKPVTLTPPSSPNPQNLPQKVENQQVRLPQVPDLAPEGPGTDQISLRPAGRIGSGIAPVTVRRQKREEEVGLDTGSAKSGKFVPPHLRPGFAGREEKPSPEAYRGRELAQRHVGSPVLCGEDGRPKTGGHERMRRGGETDLGLMGRPGSSGSRPNSR